MKVSATTKLSDPKVMAWDTDFWGVRVGRATHLDGLSEWAAENTVGMISLLIDTDRPEEAQRAEEQGYRFMDVRVTLGRRILLHARDQTTRMVEPADTVLLCDIARHAFQYTRFYADSRLDPLLCDELYATWTRSLCEQGQAIVSERDGHPVGYVTVSTDKGKSEIGLIAVACDYRGQGIGSSLVREALHRSWVGGAKEITVVTQAANIGAIRTFENCGFRTVKTQLWFHKWFDA